MTGRLLSSKQGLCCYEFLVGWFVGWLVALLVGWLIKCLVDWLVGRMNG